MDDNEQSLSWGGNTSIIKRKWWKKKMNIRYQNWEPNKGLEEKQAEIYNKNNPGPQPATAQQIIDRYNQEKIDPKTISYAFSEKNELLAYIQARDYSQIKETHLGYPWATDNCPAEVQDKLFDEMLEYVKQREEAKELSIRMNAQTRRQNIVDFFKRRKVKVMSKRYRYNLDVKEIAKLNYSKDDYTSRLGTEEDLDILINLLKADGRFSGQFSSNEDIEKYFKDRVFKAGHAILIFKDDQLVMASAPLIFKLPNDDDRESLIFRFHSILDGHESAFELLLISLAKECVEFNYGVDKPLAFFASDTDSKDIISVLESNNSEKTVTGLSFGLEE